MARTGNEADSVLLFGGKVNACASRGGEENRTSHFGRVSLLKIGSYVFFTVT